VNLDGYVPVDARLRMALQKYPELRVQEEGWKPVQIGDHLFLECVVWVFTTPDDPRPTRGSVLEPFPGKTSFSRDSELPVGMTSALGRALGYLGFGIDRGIASVDEIRARTEDTSTEVTRMKAGSAARKPAEASEKPSEAPKPSGLRKEPTEKMIGFLKRLNVERGNPLDDLALDAAIADFDLCRQCIDELQALPKD